MRILLFALLASFAVHADELLTMSNGMTCWRNDQGHVWGCSGGHNNGSGGFNDTRTGQRYENINQDQSIDTRTGQPIYRSQENSHYDDRGRYRYNND